MLGNLNTMEAILLEMKIGAEVKKDPFQPSHGRNSVFTQSGQEGPFKVLNNCYIYKDTIQVKLVDLSQVMYLVAKPHKLKVLITSCHHLGLYPQNHFSWNLWPNISTPVSLLFSTVCGHSYMPGKLTISDIKKGGKPNTSPVVFQLWGSIPSYLKSHKI